MKKSLFGLTLISLLLLLSKAALQEQDLDVPYVPTPVYVVQEMLRIAEVGKDDLLYDLGSGDGRIVINAAKEMSCRGVGVDISAQRIEESKENAIKEEVTDKVRFLQQDLFEADIREATVVTLYLLPSVNLELRPKLFRELKPGTRVVSHDFSMGEWKPDKTKEVWDNSSDHTIYYWVVPANVTGTWEWTMPTSTEKEHCVLVLDQQFQQVNGTLTVDGSEMTIENEEIIGERFQFTIERKLKERIVRWLFEGQVSGNFIKGYVRSEDGSNVNKIRWRAKRDPSTITPIDISIEDLNLNSRYIPFFF